MTAGGGRGGYGRRREVPGGVRRGGGRRRMAATPWGRAFVEAVEDLGDRARMARGRTYARSGQVVSVTIGHGMIVGEVQGSQLEPFETTVMVRPFDDDVRAGFAARVRREPGALAVLAGGQVPDDLADLLIPSSAQEIGFDCTCPDGGWPCKHAAALLYAAAELVDADPVALLRLRGLPFDDLVAAVDDASDEELVDPQDWFGERIELPALPEPAVLPATEDLEPLLLRAALRTVAADEREVETLLDGIEEIYARLTDTDR